MLNFRKVQDFTQVWKSRIVASQLMKTLLDWTCIWVVFSGVYLTRTAHSNQHIQCNPYLNARNFLQKISKSTLKCTKDQKCLDSQCNFEHMLASRKYTLISGSMQKTYLMNFKKLPYLKKNILESLALKIKADGSWVQRQFGPQS